MNNRPMILLDIDGVLSPDMSNKRRKKAGYRTRTVLGYRVHFNALHGPMLHSLARETDSELVWATTWETNANTWIAPLIRLHELPFIKVADSVWNADPDWKFPSVQQYCEGRPVLWFDDDFDKYPKAMIDFIEKRAGVPTMLYDIDSRDGLTKYDAEQAAIWLKGL